jgi:hypothetical protein
MAKAAASLNPGVFRISAAGELGHALLKRETPPSAGESDLGKSTGPLLRQACGTKRLAKR